MSQHTYIIILRKLAKSDKKEGERNGIRSWMNDTRGQNAQRNLCVSQERKIIDMHHVLK